MAQRPVVPAAVVVVGMMVVVSGEMHSACVDLLEEVVAPRVLAAIAQGWAVGLGRVAGMYLREYEEEVVLVLVQV